MICGDSPSYKSLINQDNLILLKIYEVWRLPHLWVGEWVGIWVGSCQITNNWINLNNQDNSILFEDLWSVETPPPMSGCMGGWLGGTAICNLNWHVYVHAWATQPHTSTPPIHPPIGRRVSIDHKSSHRINYLNWFKNYSIWVIWKPQVWVDEWGHVIWFCLHTYDLWRHFRAYTTHWSQSLAIEITSLIDNWHIMHNCQFWTFFWHLASYLNHLSPLLGYFS